MNYSQSIDFVNNLGEFSYNFNLDRIKKFLDRLGNPQDKLKIIHVAGTNGKGSVCAYISTILVEAGFKVGLYTSPHLLRSEQSKTTKQSNFISFRFFLNFLIFFIPGKKPYSQGKSASFIIVARLPKALRIL